MRFYDDHQRQRDRFEIIAFCIDFDGELKTIEQLDQKLEPIVEHAWGRPLPFPILLDPSFTTLERFGLRGLRTVFLIDPQGNLQKGDETDLARILEAAAHH
jgi:AhpC/TSA family protein